MCDRVGVLYAGRLVEEGPVDEVFHDPRHPYTVGLLRCIPRGGARKDQGSSTRSRASCPGSAPSCPAACSPTAARSRRTSASQKEPPLPRPRRRAPQPLPLPRAGAELPRARAPGAGRGRARRPRDGTPILRTESVRKTFHQDGHEIRAVEDVTFALGAGRDARARRRVGQRQDDARAPAARAHRADEGSVVELDGDAARAARSASATASEVRALQIVFQNPDSALNRRFSVQRILGRARCTKLLGEQRRKSATTRLRDLAALGALRRAPDPAAPVAALRRPQAARRDRARLRRRPAARRLRRADLGARRLGAGRDPQPARRAAGARRASPTCSSRTTSASCATSPTGSPCSTSGG